MIEKGEIITLENGKEYICIENVNKENNNYLYLISNFKPLEIKFARQIIKEDDTLLEIIENREKKEELLKEFQNIRK